LFSKQPNVTVFGVTSAPREGLERLGATRWNTLAAILGWTF
jgi:hypothetical protein